MNIDLLWQLRKAEGGFVSLDSLGSCRDRVLLDLEALRAFGFSIEHHPYLGLAYRGPAQRLCPDQIEHRLETRRIGRRIAVWNRVSSTNDLAARASASAANDGLVVLAEGQSAGRGRRGRTWSARPGSSVLMSVLLFPTGPTAEPAWLTALGAVAVAEVVTAWTGRRAAIKWPNDVRVNGRKIAGILVERGAGAVIGIGLNVNLSIEDFPEDLRESATSVQILNDRPVDRSDLVRDLIGRLDARYDPTSPDRYESLVARWRDLSEHLGRRVCVSTPSGEARGRLVDIDLEDGLRLRDDFDSRVHVPMGQVLSIVTESASSLSS